MQIIGNSPSQDLVRKLLNPEAQCRTIALVGPSHVGKRSFLEQELNQLLADEDIFIADLSVESSREAVSFSITTPILSPYRAIIIDNAEGLSDAAKDAYLKLCEEPPETCRVFLVLSDEGFLPHSLTSRLRWIIRWSLLSDEEITKVVESEEKIPDSNLVHLCYGKPGFYSTLSKSVGFTELEKAISDYDPFSSATPAVLKELKSGASLEREAVSWIIYQIARKNHSSKKLLTIGLLNYASNLIKYPSVNAELHWQSSWIVSSV
jgi:DNA polymerase III delta prime subunit